MTRHSRALLVVLLVGGLLVGWWWSAPSRRPPAATPPAAAAPTRGGSLVAAIRGEPRSFNRLAFRDLTTELVSVLTQARLARINKATQDLEPWLAQSWTTSPDGLTFTLTLREGLQWSDGTPFTAADVAFTVQAIRDPKSKSVLTSSLEVAGRPIRIDTPDARTVVAALPGPFGPGLRFLDSIPILPKHRLEGALAAGTFAEAWAPTTPPADMVGMGPFRLASYAPGQRLTFERNPHFWRRDEAGVALPYLDGLVLEIVPDQDAEFLRIQSGQIDIPQQQLRAQDYASARELEGKGALKMLELGVGLDPDVFFFNLRPAMWAKDPRRAWLPTADFRRAISHAVDREAYANTVFLGAAVPVHGPVSPGNRAWFWPDIPRYRPDTAKAQALLAGLGLANRDADPWLEDAAGTEARFSVLTYRGNSSLERGAQVLKESLAPLGVAVDIVPLEQGALIERLLAGTFESIFFFYLGSDTDPAMQSDFWLSSGSAHIWNIGQKAPATDWERELDDVMTRQATATDPAERVRLFREAQRIFSDQLPALYFAAPRLYVALSARVRNAAPAVTRPQILWSADTLAVAPDAASR